MQKKTIHLEFAIQKLSTTYILRFCSIINSTSSIIYTVVPSITRYSVFLKSTTYLFTKQATGHYFHHVVTGSLGVTIASTTLGHTKISYMTLLSTKKFTTTKYLKMMHRSGKKFQNNKLGI